LKTCIYCGGENAEKAEICLGCGNSLALAKGAAEGRDEFLPVNEPPDISVLTLDYVVENGFSYPDWNALSSALGQFPKEDWPAVCHEISKRWLLRLKEDLGGSYNCYESEHFLLLAAEGQAVSRAILSYAEGSLGTIEAALGPLVNRRIYGKRAILAFSEADDYYAYISHFYAEGEHILSMGIFLSEGYMHIAFPFTIVFAAKSVITHELVHNCIAHLSVPKWIHEGLAQRIERVVLGSQFSLDGELAARHHAYWNQQNIQTFWSGASFDRPGDGTQLSYSLSAILVELLSENWNDFLVFVEEADYRDAGQDASLKILGRCLGEVVGGFLGPGEWRPQRKAIAQELESKKTNGPARASLISWLPNPHK